MSLVPMVVEDQVLAPGLEGVERPLGSGGGAVDGGGGEQDARHVVGGVAHPAQGGEQVVARERRRPAGGRPWAPAAYSSSLVSRALDTLEVGQLPRVLPRAPPGGAFGQPGHAGRRALHGDPSMEEPAGSRHRHQRGHRDGPPQLPRKMVGRCRGSRRTPRCCPAPSAARRAGRGRPRYPSRGRSRAWPATGEVQVAQHAEPVVHADVDDVTGPHQGGGARGSVGRSAAPSTNAPP